MKKQEKIDLIALGIRKTQLLRMYFRYDENYFYYYPNAVNERLILRRRCRYIEVVTAGTVKFGINTVQRKARYCVDIRSECAFGPCREYLT